VPFCTFWAKFSLQGYDPGFASALPLLAGAAAIWEVSMNFKALEK
jgi:hypothetical protein